MKRPLVDRLNRGLLVVLGLLLVLGGLAVLLLSFGAFGRDRSNLPVIDDYTSSVIADAEWFWPAMAGLGLVFAGLAGWWLLGQLRVQRLTRLTLASTGGGATHLAAAALTDAVRAEALAAPGVGRARAWLRHDSSRPDLALTVWLAEPYDLTDTLGSLERQVLPRAAHALGNPRLRGFIELEVTGSANARRVR